MEKKSLCAFWNLIFSLFLYANTALYLYSFYLHDTFCNRKYCAYVSNQNLIPFHQWEQFSFIPSLFFSLFFFLRKECEHLMLARVAVDMNSSLTASLCIQKVYPLVLDEILIRVPSQHRYCRCAVLVISVIINDLSGIEKIVACQLRLVIVIHSAKGFNRSACKGRKNRFPSR